MSSKHGRQYPNAYTLSNVVDASLWHSMTLCATDMQCCRRSLVVRPQRQKNQSGPTV
jgi:hypothetical protein